MKDHHLKLCSPSDMILVSDQSKAQVFISIYQDQRSSNVGNIIYILKPNEGIKFMSTINKSHMLKIGT
jgi:ribosome-binding factor A